MHSCLLVREQVADTACMLKDVVTCFNFLLDLFGCDQWPHDVRELHEMNVNFALQD